MDIRQSENYAKYIRSLGWIVEQIGKTNVFIRPLGPFSLIKIQRAEKFPDLSDVDRLVRRYRPLLIKLEPENSLPTTDYGLLPYNFQEDNWPLLPTKSLVLDLSLASLDLLPKDTRYEIRKAKENSLSCSLSSNIELFYELLRETMKIGGWSVPIKKEVANLYYSFQPNNSAILIVSAVNREPGPTVNIPIAACLLIWDKDTAHYMYAALTKKGRQLGAAYAILFETIKFLKSRKIKSLDLEGVYDERYPSRNKNWRGFTKFKMGWNGKTVEYPGSFTWYASPVLKFLFSLGAR